MTDPRVLVVARLHGLAGRAPELRELLQTLAQHARREPRCSSFDILTADEPGELVLLSGWEDEPALRAHYDTLHYRRYRQAVGPLLTRASDVVVHHLSATAHVRDPNPPDPERLG